MATTDLVKYLKQHPVFASLSDAYLAEIAEHTQTLSPEADEVVFRTGQPANCFYLVMEGQIGLYTGVGTANEVMVHTVDTGEILGLSWIVPPYQWEFDAKAMVHCTLLQFDGAFVRDRCERDPVFGYGTMKKVVSLMLSRLHGVRSHMSERIRLLEHELNKG